MSLGANATIMAAGANIATTLSTILCFFYLYKYYKDVRYKIKKEIKNTKKIKPARIRKTLKDILYISIPMTISGILSTINKNIDSMTVVRGLKNFLSEEQAKIQYGILSGKVDTLVTLPMSLNMAFSTALIPATASAKALKDEKTIEKRISFSILVTILIGLPCMVGMITFAEPILRLLFPNATSGKVIFQVSSVSIIFVVLEQTICGALHGIGKVFSTSLALGVGVIIKLILNIVLIPIEPNKCIVGGTVGAAFATIICHLTAVVIEINILKRQIDIKLNLAKYVVKPIVAVFVMSLFSYGTYIILLNKINPNISTIISMCMAITVYFGMVIILKIFTREELLMIPYGKKIYKVLEEIGLYKN